MFAHVGTEKRFSLLSSNNTCTLQNERKKPLARPSFVQADVMGSGSGIMSTCGFVTITTNCEQGLTATAWARAFVYCLKQLI
jgi:hypothetical protein